MINLFLVVILFAADLEAYMMPPPPEFFREKKQEADWDELFESLSESDSDSSKDGAIGGGN